MLDSKKPVLYPEPTAFQLFMHTGGITMQEYVMQHKSAWEFDAYAFWVKHNGTPTQLAQRILADPVKALRKYAAYFNEIRGLRIANICGSCGKKAVPLAVLGAQVTIFDLSEENRRYACELAAAANVPLAYEVCDVISIDPLKFDGTFDVVFMEGGVLHYFHDLDAFMTRMHALLHPNGYMICSDFHPFTKIQDSLGLQQPAVGYFSSELIEGEMAHARFYPEEVRNRIPKCIYRKYTISEILNAAIAAGFTIKRFDEHPAWEDPMLPGEFTLIANR